MTPGELTDQHRDEATRFLAEHDYGIPVEIHADRQNTTVYVRTDTPRIHLLGYAAALELPVHRACDHGTLRACDNCDAWESFWVDVQLETTSMRLTTGPLAIPTQRRAA